MAGMAGMATGTSPADLALAELAFMTATMAIMATRLTIPGTIREPARPIIMT
jgi:hypothetical protein